MKAEDEKTIYNIISCIGFIVMLILLFLVKPTNIYFNALDFILFIALIIVQVKIYLQLRKLKHRN